MSLTDAIADGASSDPPPPWGSLPRGRRGSQITWTQGPPETASASRGGAPAFGAPEDAWPEQIRGRGLPPFGGDEDAWPAPVHRGAPRTYMASGSGHDGRPPANGAVRLRPPSRPHVPGHPGGTRDTFRDGFGAGAATAHGPTALVVDDDYRSTLAFTALLERNHFAVVSAPSGYTALDALDDREDIGIVVMDIMMSVMDGYAAIAAIRRRPRFAHLPIIAVTAKADDGEERERCLSAGASDFIPKPIDPSEFLSIISSWLNRSAATNPPQASE